MTIRVVNVRGLKTPEQRAGVCYCGRGFAGWPASRWGNPFKPKGYRGGASVNAQQRFDEEQRKSCLEDFRDFAEYQATKYPEWLADLWEACERGAKPLGCWCATATHGDGQPIVCHAQILVAMLHEKYVEPKAVTGG